MIVAAALCPGPPLLDARLSGTDPAAEALRTACGTALSVLQAAGPSLIAVVGAATTTGVLPEEARPDLSVYGPLPRPHTVAPLSVGMGALLLDTAGWTGPRLLHTVAPGADHPAVAATLTAAADRVGLLVIADGSGARTLPGRAALDDRAAGFDLAVEHAVTGGDLAALADVDPKLAEELMTDAWPAWQVLAAALGHTPVTGTVHYSAAPYGVGYLVATLRPATR